jgi:hypothetical protein
MNGRFIVYVTTPVDPLTLRASEFTFNLAGITVAQTLCMGRLPPRVGRLLGDTRFTFGGKDFNDPRADYRATARQQREQEEKRSNTPNWKVRILR